MASDAGRRLFHTIVVVGAALGGCSSESGPSPVAVGGDAAAGKTASGEPEGGDVALEAGLRAADARAHIEAGGDVAAATDPEGGAVQDASTDAVRDAAGDALDDVQVILPMVLK